MSACYFFKCIMSIITGQWRCVTINHKSYPTQCSFIITHVERMYLNFKGCSINWSVGYSLHIKQVLWPLLETWGNVSNLFFYLFGASWYIKILLSWLVKSFIDLYISISLSCQRITIWNYFDGVFCIVLRELTNKP